MNKTMSFSGNQYQFSQKYDLLPAISYTLVGIFFAILLGILDTIICAHLPKIDFSLNVYVVLFNFFVVGVTSWILRVISCLLARKAKVRNKIVNFLMTFVICLFCFYSSVFALLVDFRVVGLTYSIQLFLSPVVIFGLMFKTIMFYGEMLIYGSPLFILIILFIPAFMALKIKGYYCEDCQVWYSTYMFFSFNNGTLESNINNSINGSYADALSDVVLCPDANILPELNDYKIGNRNIIKYIYCRCPKCQRKSIINIDKRVLTKSKQGVGVSGISRGILVKDTYIDNKTDLLFRHQKDIWYKSY
jgi:hypothetical protein